MNKTRRFSLVPYLVICLAISVPLQAEIDISIDAPILNDPDEEYTQLANLLEQHLNNAAGDIEEMLNPLLNKPDVGFALSQALSLSTVLSQQSDAPFLSKRYLALGINGTIYTPYFDTDRLESEFNNLNEEDDFPIGAAIQVLQLSGGVPLKKEKISLFGTLAFFNADTSETQIRNGDISAGIEYRPFPSQRLGRNMTWLPLSGKGSLGFRYLEAGFSMDLGTMTRNVVIDPDGAGPLPDQDWDIELTPDFAAGIESFSLYAPLSIQSQLSLYGTFFIALGAGVLPSWSRSRITLEGDSSVMILGPLSDLISEPAFVSLTGGTDPITGAPVSFYLSGKLLIDMGSLYLSIPVAYQPGKSKGSGTAIHNLAVGIYMGIQQ